MSNEPSTAVKEAARRIMGNAQWYKSEGYEDWMAGVIEHCTHHSEIVALLERLDRAMRKEPCDKFMGTCATFQTRRTMMPNTPDSITIDGVTITRQQWELINQHGTWESFVAANTKSGHYDGEPCGLTVFNLDIDRAEGFRFEYTGKVVDKDSPICWYRSIEGGGYSIWHIPPGPRWELRAVRIKPEHVKGERCTAPVRDGENTDGVDYFLFDEMADKVSCHQWFLADTGQIWRAKWDIMVPHWTLTAVPKQLTPRYDVGDWVVPEGEQPVQIVEYDERGITTTDGTRYDWFVIRPAVCEDFMVTFGSVKAWMEKHDDERMREYFEGDGGRSYGWLYDWEVARNLAAGIMEMPKEFWI